MALAIADRSDAVRAGSGVKASREDQADAVAMPEEKRGIPACAVHERSPATETLNGAPMPWAVAIAPRLTSGSRPSVMQEDRLLASGQNLPRAGAEKLLDAPMAVGAQGNESNLQGARQAQNGLGGLSCFVVAKSDRMSIPNAMLSKKVAGLLRRAFRPFGGATLHGENVDGSISNQPQQCQHMHRLRYHRTRSGDRHCIGSNRRAVKIAGTQSRSGGGASWAAIFLQTHTGAANGFSS